MTLLVCSVGLALVGLVAGACLTAILIYFNPDSSEPLVFVLLYLSLFIAFTSFFTLIGWLIRRISSKRRFSLSVRYAVRQLEIAFRQGILFASILVAALALQSQRVLAWWNLLILVAVVGIAEWWLTRK